MITRALGPSVKNSYYSAGAFGLLTGNNEVEGEGLCSGDVFRNAGVISVVLSCFGFFDDEASIVHSDRPRIRHSAAPRSHPPDLGLKNIKDCQ